MLAKTCPSTECFPSLYGGATFVTLLTRVAMAKVGPSPPRQLYSVGFGILLQHKITQDALEL